MILINSIW